MAGVREVEGIEPISQPRGLPEDVTKTTVLKNKWWGVDGHSHSWLSAVEVMRVIKEQEDSIGIDSWSQWGYLDGNCWYDMEGRPNEVQDFRLVFWFDN